MAASYLIISLIPPPHTSPYHLSNEEHPPESSHDTEPQLYIGPDDIRVSIVRSPDGTIDGYLLHVRRKEGMNSVLLTEAGGGFAYRALEWNETNGDEMRLLDGKPLVSESSRYSIIDSTPEQHPEFGSAFTLFIPPEMEWGYPWTDSGRFSVEEGTPVNIRAFSKPYADYTGSFQDNQFVFANVPPPPAAVSKPAPVEPPEPQLHIGPQDIRVSIVRSPDGTIDGYFLYVRRKEGMNSVLLTEESGGFAYRALEWNETNGDEMRLLDGKPLVSESSRYSIIDSTPEQHREFGSAFTLFIPPEMEWGYPWTDSGRIPVEEGTIVNIRAFSKPYADYTGSFQDNQFMFTNIPPPPAPAQQPILVEEEPVEEEPVEEEPIEEEPVEEEPVEEEPVEEEPVEEEPIEEEPAPKRPSIFRDPMHGIDLLAGATMLPSPFLVAANAGLGYVNGILLHPVYFGVRLTGFIGWPRQDFPYEYTLTGQPVATPMMQSFGFRVPIGLVFTPFRSNRDWEFTVEVAPGMDFIYLWDREFGELTVSGNLYQSFAVSAALGVGWKGIILRVRGDYNTQLGFMYGADLGYTIRLPYKARR